MKEAERFLAEHGFYITATEGDSMAPMLKTGDRIVVKKPTFPLKKYDIPVYRRDGHYTMHRIVKASKSGYVICGDNRIRLERDITEQDIVSVFAGVYRDGKLMKAEDEELLSYGKKACQTYPIRLLKGFVKRIRGKRSSPIR